MPEEEYVWLPKADLLDFEEIARLAAAFAAQGVSRIRLTGGEPLLRRGLATLVAALRALPGIEDLALTTNALLLADQAADLARAGLSRVTVSLDSLQPETYARLAGRAGLESALAGIAAASRAGLPLKLNTVVIRGENEGELGALLDYARAAGAELRLIEYMDVGGATRWSARDVVSRAEILSRIEATHGRPEPEGARGAAPAERFGLPDGSRFGLIASTTAPFCAACDRARLTADGRLFLCLYALEGHDLRGLLRGGLDEAGLRARLAEIWSQRADRGAEQRLALGQRRPLALAGELKTNPHLEMHTRGG